MVKEFIRLTCMIWILLQVISFTAPAQQFDTDSIAGRKSRISSGKAVSPKHPGYAYQDPFRMPVAPLPDNSQFRMPIWVPDSTVTFHIVNPLSNKDKRISPPDLYPYYPENNSELRPHDRYKKPHDGNRK